MLASVCFLLCSYSKQNQFYKQLFTTGPLGITHLRDFKPIQQAKVGTNTEADLMTALVQCTAILILTEMVKI